MGIAGLHSRSLLYMLFVIPAGARLWHAKFKPEFTKEAALCHGGYLEKRIRTSGFREV